MTLLADVVANVAPCCRHAKSQRQDPELRRCRRTLASSPEMIRRRVSFPPAPACAGNAASSAILRCDLACRQHGATLRPRRPIASSGHFTAPPGAERVRDALRSELRVRTALCRPPCPSRYSRRGWVQVVPRQLGELAVGQELRAHVARIRVQRGRVKVFHAVEQPDVRMKLLRTSAGVVPRPVVAPVDAADTERGGHCAGEDFDTARVQRLTIF